MEAPLISIIVPTYNRSELLRSAINSLLQQGTDGKFSYEIIIIDDASTDETREVIGEIIKRSPGLVKYFKGEGKGYTCALNRGLAESHGEWLALFDDDEFLVNRTRIERLAGLFKKFKINISWSCLTRARKTDPRILSVMKKMGCWQIVLCYQLKMIWNKFLML